MKKISINNAITYQAFGELTDKDMTNIIDHWDWVVQAMDDQTREEVAFDFAPCTKARFLQEYLNRAPFDLLAY